MDESGAPAPGTVLDVLWHQLLSRWEDADAHAAFLQAAQASGRLADAALRYRAVAGDRERGGRAETQLAAITVLALASLETARQRPPPKRRLGAYAALAIGIFFIGALLLLVRALRR